MNADTTPQPSPPSPTTTDVLLLSCMDFRLMAAIGRYMEERGWTDRYDHVVLAGASLGATTDVFPAWNKTFWDHLGLALDLHSVHTVLLLDHRDCGAYRQILGEDHAPFPDAETLAHAGPLHHLANAIREKYPQLTVETLLMDLQGQVITVPPS